MAAGRLPKTRRAQNEAVRPVDVVARLMPLLLPRFSFLSLSLNVRFLPDMVDCTPDLVFHLKAYDNTSYLFVRGNMPLTSKIDNVLAASILSRLGPDELPPTWRSWASVDTAPTDGVGTSTGNASLKPEVGVECHQRESGSNDNGSPNSTDSTDSTSTSSFVVQRRKKGSRSYIRTRDRRIDRASIDTAACDGGAHAAIGAYIFVPATPPPAAADDVDPERCIRTSRALAEFGRTPEQLLMGLLKANEDTSYDEVMFVVGPRFEDFLTRTLGITASKIRRIRVAEAMEVAYRRLEPMVLIFLLASNGRSGLLRLRPSEYKGLNGYFRRVLVKRCPMYPEYGKMAYVQYAEKIDRVLKLVRAPRNRRLSGDKAKPAAPDNCQGRKTNDMRRAADLICTFPEQQDSTGTTATETTTTTTASSEVLVYAGASSPTMDMQVDDRNSPGVGQPDTCPTSNSEFTAMMERVKRKFGYPMGLQ